MEELYLQDIYIYPVKSLGGISLPWAQIEQTGLQHDRRWLLIDEEGNFLSQRTVVQMSMLQANIADGMLEITHKKGLLSPLIISLTITSGNEVMVKIWDDTCSALELHKEANEWFTHALGINVRLVYMPSSTKRLVDINYATNDEIVSFADSFPLMLVGQASLDDLNTRLDAPVRMNRFRPNLVFHGGEAFCEDAFKTFRIGDVMFNAVKPCSRCVLTTINQEDGVRGQEPLRTLGTYRKDRNKILFGQNLLQKNPGIIKIGDKLQIISTANET
ncbi:MAG: MOSC domain-containing protein [Segetibacter sp.]